MSKKDYPLEYRTREVTEFIHTYYFTDGTNRSFPSDYSNVNPSSYGCTIWAYSPNQGIAWRKEDVVRVEAFSKVRTVRQVKARVSETWEDLPDE